MIKGPRDGNHALANLAVNFVSKTVTCQATITLAVLLICQMTAVQSKSGTRRIFQFRSEGSTLNLIRLLFLKVFGPLLPIVDVDDIEEAIEFINDRYS